MRKYIKCVAFLIYYWVLSIILIIISYGKGRRNPFRRKLLFQAHFNNDIIVNGFARSIRSYVESEFQRMLAICRRTQSRNNFRILEIGVGTGPNFPYYPERNTVTLVDINPHYEEFLIESLNNNPHVSVENVLTTSAENMKKVHSRSMDCVVSTHTLCAVDNVDAVLKEVKRILRPGGCFLFVEPVRDPEDTINYVFQIIISPLVKFFAGYDLKRNLLLNIRENFRIVMAYGFRTEFELFLTPHIRGIAVK